MRIQKIALGILAAGAAFGLGFGAFKAVALVSSLMPAFEAKAAPAETVPVIETIRAETVPAPELSEPAEETDPNDYDAYNWSQEYYLDEAALPKAFADIAFLDLQTHEYNEKADEDDSFFLPIPPKGFIQAKIPVKLDRIAIGGKNISFQTATVNGISYKFTGRFFDHEDYSDEDTDWPALKGRLIKIKDGKWAAEMEAKFYISGC